MRESDEDVESEIERSIFNIVVPTRVGRERLFICRQTTTGNGIWTKLWLGTGISLFLEWENGIYCTGRGMNNLKKGIVVSPL